MTNTLKPITGTRTSVPFTGTSLSTLVSGNYVTSTNPFDCTINRPSDVVIELGATPASATSGGKQCLLYIQESLNGVDYRSGPNSGTTTTDDMNLLSVGALPMNSTAAQMGTFSLVQALGYVPNSFKIIVRNDAGVNLTAATVFVSEITNTIV